MFREAKYAFQKEEECVSDLEAENYDWKARKKTIRKNFRDI